MTFTSIIFIVQVFLMVTLILFIRKTIFIRIIPTQAQVLALILSLIPILGIIVFIGGCIMITLDDE